MSCSESLTESVHVPGITVNAIIPEPMMAPTPSAVSSEASLSERSILKVLMALMMLILMTELLNPRQAARLPGPNAFARAAAIRASAQKRKHTTRSELRAM